MTTFWARLMSSMVAWNLRGVFLIMGLGGSPWFGGILLLVMGLGGREWEFVFGVYVRCPHIYGAVVM